MQDIIELERRIASAFDRIDRGLEQSDRARASVTLPLAQMDKIQTDALRVSLESAQASCADWALRYAALEAQLAQATQTMGDEITKLTAELAATSSELQASSKMQTDDQSQPPTQELQVLQDQLTELRSVLSEQKVELTQLRSQRAQEIEELQSIVAALTPLIEEAKPHA